MSEFYNESRLSLMEELFYERLNEMVEQHKKGALSKKAFTKKYKALVEERNNLRKEMYE